MSDLNLELRRLNAKLREQWQQLKQGRPWFRIEIMEDNQFSTLFQRFLGDGKIEPPENIRRLLAERGVFKCHQERPCWLDGDGAVICRCLARARRWRAFWRLVKGDLEGGWPQTIDDGRHSFDPKIIYSHPIATWRCPVCGKREDCYELRHRGSSQMVAVPYKADDWVYRTSVVLECGKVVEIDTCSVECSEKARERWHYEPSPLAHPVTFGPCKCGHSYEQHYKDPAPNSRMLHCSECRCDRYEEETSKPARVPCDKVVRHIGGPIRGERVEFMIIDDPILDKSCLAP